MKRHYELTIDENYCNFWGIEDSAREFFQNSYDEEVQNPESKSFYFYDKESHVLCIGNKNATLKAETLLLGSSSKISDDDTIGNFGEGYKIATLVALRSGHPVVICNPGANEVWTSRFVKSKKYGGRKILAFDIESSLNIKDKLFYKKNKGNDYSLCIEIHNIFEDQFEKIVSQNLNLQKSIYPEKFEIIGTSYGDIILEGSKSSIYVSGLYVNEDDKLNYSYDIKPKFLKLGRDRKMADTFLRREVTSKMWIEAIFNNKEDEELLQKFYDLINNSEFSDLSSCSSIITIHGSYNFSSMYNECCFVSDKLKEMFIENNVGCAPVYNENSKRRMEILGNKTSFVSKQMYDILISNSDNSLFEIKKDKTLYERYYTLLNSLREFMTESQKNECDDLLKRSRFLLDI